MNKEGVYYLSLIISALLVIIYILQINFPITEFLTLNSKEFNEKPWTLLTSAFIHYSLSHLISNLFFFAFFGLILERIIGSKKFLIFLIFSAVFSNLSAFIFYPNSDIFGISAVVSSFLVALSVYNPKLIGLYLGVPMRMYAILIFWLITNLLLIKAKTDIAAEAHLFGGFLGLLFGIWMRENYKEKREEKKEEDVEISEKEIERWEKTYMK